MIIVKVVKIVKIDTVKIIRKIVESRIIIRYINIAGLKKYEYKYKYK